MQERTSAGRNGTRTDYLSTISALARTQTETRLTKAKLNLEFRLGKGKSKYGKRKVAIVNRIDTVERTAAT